MSNLEKLFQPIFINGLQLPNRIIMPPMTTCYATNKGTVTQRLIDYYTTRAVGGAGLVMVEASYIDYSGKGHLSMVGIYDDHMVSGLKKLTQSVHDVDGKIGIQIHHVGSRASSKVINSMPIAPSPIPEVGGEYPRELSVPEIRDLVEKYGQAARRALEAGFDAIEIHMAHGYLVSQFLSPYSNKRTDEYGQTAEGRARFAVEIVQRIRQEVGPKYPILVKLNSTDFVTGGITLDMCKTNVRLLVEAGVDAITVSAGIGESNEYMIPPMGIPQGFNIERTRAIKEISKVPVIAVGRIDNPEMAENILQRGDADLIAFGRTLIADPELPKKAKEMRLEDIRPCIACNQGCIGRQYSDAELACLVNPVAGREGQFNLSVTSSPKRVMVIGGGPAGLTAASTAAKRGHKVTLYEAGDVLGGQLQVAKMPPFKTGIGKFVKFLEHDARQSGVEIITGHRVVAEDLLNNQPEAVVLATGAVPAALKVPGAERCITAESCLSGNEKVTGPCVIIGGGSVGCETAHLLAEQGVQVTILEMTGSIALDLEKRSRRVLLQRLLELGVNSLVNSRVTKIGDNFVEYERLGLNSKLTDINEVIVAVGYKSNTQTEIEETCEKMGIPVFTIGDRKSVRSVIEATHEGFDCALGI